MLAHDRGALLPMVCLSLSPLPRLHGSPESVIPASVGTTRPCGVPMSSEPVLGICWRQRRWQLGGCIRSCDWSLATFHTPNISRAQRQTAKMDNCEVHRKSLTNKAITAYLARHLASYHLANSHLALYPYPTGCYTLLPMSGLFRSVWISSRSVCWIVRQNQ